MDWIDGQQNGWMDGWMDSIDTNSTKRMEMGLQVTAEEIAA